MYCQTINHEKNSSDIPVSIDYSINPIQFKLNSYTDYNKESFIKIATILIEKNISQIQINGHCTESEFEKRPSISSSRAHKIMADLVALGFSKEKIKIVDQKAEQPINPENEIENARVDIYIIKE